MISAKKNNNILIWEYKIFLFFFLWKSDNRTKHTISCNLSILFYLLLKSLKNKFKQVFKLCFELEVPHPILVSAWIINYESDKSVG